MASGDEMNRARAAIDPKVAYFVDEAGFSAAATSATLWTDALEGSIHATTVVISDIHETYLGYPGGWKDAAGALRDIFGNPFRPVTFDPEWRTTTALALATGIYDERAFDRLPILADALQDAGCDNDDILTHLRDTTTPHVRGCWALDLVLGKS
jgi:hypothetical protein